MQPDCGKPPEANVEGEGGDKDEEEEDDDDKGNEDRYDISSDICVGTDIISVLMKCCPWAGLLPLTPGCSASSYSVGQTQSRVLRSLISVVKGSSWSVHGANALAVQTSGTPSLISTVRS